MLLADQEFAESHGWPILAEWIDGVVIGCDPARMGLGPVHAIKTLMQRVKRDWTSLDTLEINEAFAAQALACLKTFNLALDVSTAETTVRMTDGQLINLIEKVVPSPSGIRWLPVEQDC